MKSPDLVPQRLFHQRLAGATFTTPAEVVAWLGAVQAQDYAGAKWAVAQRMTGLTDTAMDQALADGSVLRTHVLRPTWHFVTPDDIRWMLALTAPRIMALCAYGDRKLSLTPAIFERSHAALEKALRGGKQLTRSELAAALRRARVETEGLRLVHLLMRAELDALICSGARRGKQFTYALLSERAPQARVLEREEALAELASRYITSHGPATLRDYMWWSGLTAADARAGLDLAGPRISAHAVDGHVYWSASSKTPLRKKAPAVLLLPNYDEYVVGYTDRAAIFDERHAAKLKGRNVLFSHTIVAHGQIVGTWTRTVKKGAVTLEAHLFAPLDAAGKKALQGAVERYGGFMEVPAVLRSGAV